MPSHRIVNGIQVIEGSGRSSETNGVDDRLCRPPYAHDDAERNRHQSCQRESQEHALRRNPARQSTNRRSPPVFRPRADHRGAGKKTGETRPNASPRARRQEQQDGRQTDNQHGGIPVIWRRRRRVFKRFKDGSVGAANAGKSAVRTPGTAWDETSVEECSSSSVTAWARSSRSPICFTSGSCGIFSLSLSTCARYCICAVCSCICCGQPGSRNT